MVASSGVKAILFDADGVIQLPADGWTGALEALCGDPTRSSAFFAEVFEAEKPCLTGAGEFSAALAEVLCRWGSSSTVEEALSVWTRIEPDRAMLELVARLRATATMVVLATNQQSYRATYMSRELSYASIFDHLLYSCEIGHAKPGVEYFEAGLRKLGIQPREALFLDDHEINVAAARSAGLNAEVYHLSEGLEKINAILESYGIDVP